MGSYSIKELEKLSGIKAHTIRIWEKRYHVLNPDRSDTNIRNYSDEDLKKIISVALLNNHGIRISKIADLSSEELGKKVKELTSSKADAPVHIDQLIVSMINLDEEFFDRELSDLVNQFGLEYTMGSVVYPFLQKIGVLWQTGNITPAQEHFVSNLIRQKIIAAIDRLPMPPSTARKAVLFLPEHELHELGLLFHHYVVKKAGIRTYYLGQMVPYKDVRYVCDIHHPQFLVTAFTSTFPAGNIQQFLQTLCSDHSASQILVTGQILQKMALRIPSNLHLFNSTPELVHLLRV